jgi:hypothetical protein
MENEKIQKLAEKEKTDQPHQQNLGATGVKILTSA